MANSKSIRAGRAFVELFADNSKLIKGLRASANHVKAFGSRVRNIGLGLSAAMAPATAGIVAAMKHFSNYGDEVAKMAKRTGLSVESLSELQYVASQSGTNFETLENAFRKMQRSIYDAGRGLKTSIDGFKDLGLTVNDLKDLTPEQQFKLLAERISQIENPSRRAGVAMTLFGRTGTNLLPMFANGAKGIDQLQAKARELGLTMSGQDAKAAEDFTDALDSMWKTVKMGVFQIGAALAPALQSMVDRMTQAVKVIRDWVDNNRGMIVSAAKIVAILSGIGIGLTAVGTTISLVGSAMLVFAGVLNKVMVGIGLLKTALLALATPMGLIVVALGAMSAYMIKATGAGGQALQWLGDKFKALKSEAYETYDGIAAAMGSGDISQAAKIMWLAIKMEWGKGIGALSSMMEDLRFGIEAAHENLAASIAKTWTRLWSNLSKATNKFKTTYARIVEWWGSQHAIGGIDEMEAKGLITKEDADFRRQEIEQQSQQELSRIKRQGAARQKQIDDELDANLENIDQSHRARLEAISEENQARESEIESDLAKARAEWQAAIAEARKNRQGSAKDSGPDTSGIDAPELPDMQDVMKQLKTSVTGTFNAAVVGGLGMGNTAERTAKATESIATSSERTERNTRNINPQFS